MNDKKSQGHPIIGCIVLGAIVWGVCWLYSNNEAREQQRKREIFREYNWTTAPDGRLHISPARPDSKQRVEEIERRYNRPIWETVEEDHSGPGKSHLRR